MTDRRAQESRRIGRRWRGALARVAMVAAIAVAAVAGSSVPAAADGNLWLDPERFAIESFTTASSDMQAGGHPDVSTSFSFRHETFPNPIPILPPEPVTYGRPSRLEIDMPFGLVGDPTGFATCSVERFMSQVPCPPLTQVGVANILAAGFFGVRFPPSGVYNLEHGPGEPVLLGVKPADTLYALIRVKVKPDGGLKAIADELPLAHPLVINDITLWGVPADHNRENTGRDWPRVPFMTGPTECETKPTTTLTAYSYEGKVATATHSLDTPPENCERVPFEPTMTAQPTSRAAAGPTGLDVQIRVPQNQLPNGVTAGHVRSVSIALPEGMKVSPSSASGLAGCAPGQFGYRTNSAVTCPDSSKIGAVSIKTPLLREPMAGSVYLARQNDNPFGSLLALYIAVEGSGVQIKLTGRVDPDPLTGRLTTTFDDNPQLPFEQFDLAFKSGPRAPLTNPQTCGTYQSETTIVSWTRRAVSATTPMTIDQDCQPVGFRPTLQAGSVNPAGGRASAFSLTFARGDHDQELSHLAVDLPEGVTGKIADAVLCSEAAAAAGTCGEQSRIGTVTSSAGPGTSPFFLPGRAYIGGAYKGAPFSMSIVVPAVAGPFDLGTVVVRAAIHVDRRDASLRVVSDPMPRILQGIPLQVRSVNVAVDKPGFMLNPTGCSVKQVLGHIVSHQGTGADVSSRYQVGGCGSLPIRQRMALSVGARGKTATNRRTPFTATIRQAPGQGNLRSVEVILPKTLNGRLDVIQRDRACTMAQFEADRCPNVIGQGVAITPLLRDPLRGPAYFVYNPARKLPDIVVRLRGQVDIDLVGRVTIPRDLTLRTTFDTVPDVPMSMFRLRLESGDTNGPIGVVRNLCTREGRSGRARITMIGQNGRRVDVRQRLRINGCARGARRQPRRAQSRRAQARRAAATSRAAELAGEQATGVAGAR